MRWLCFLCCSESGVTLTRGMPVGHCFYVMMTMVMNNKHTHSHLGNTFGNGWWVVLARHPCRVQTLTSRSQECGSLLIRNCSSPGTALFPKESSYLRFISLSGDSWNPLVRGGKGPGTLPSFTRLCGVSALWGLLAETSAAWVQHLPQPIPASSLPPIHYSWEPTPQISI